MISRLVAIALASTLLVPFSAPKAQIQTFYFGGQLTGFHDPSAISPFSVGESFAGWYSFDAATPGQFPRGYDAVYEYAITAMSVTIGSFTYNSTPGSYTSIYVENAGIHPDVTTDYYQVFGGELLGPAIGDGTITPTWLLSFRDADGSTFPDLGLPTTPTPAAQTSFDIRLQDSETHELRYLAAGWLSYFSVTPPIATPIPEPETYAMLLAGLALLGFKARRRRRQAV